MAQNKLLSIIIPTWNTDLITQKCVQTIKNNLPSKDIEIIVVDNGSTDQTKHLFSKQTDLIYIRNSTNLGFSKANNIGAAKASGKFLLFLNSDMEVIDISIFSMLEFLQNNPNIGIIGPAFLNPDNTPQASVFPSQTAFNAIREYWLGIPNSYSKYIPNSSKPVSVWAISGGAVLVSKSLFNRIGGWNENYFMYYEDLDFCRAVRQQGLQIYYYPDCRVVHRHGSSGHKLADSANQWRRLIPGSIKFHGLFNHYLLYLILLLGQKWQKVSRSIKTT